MVRDPRLPLISFTGSARRPPSWPRWSGSLGRTLLELSGNNAVIVDDSADMDLAVRAIVLGSGDRGPAVHYNQAGACPGLLRRRVARPVGQGLQASAHRQSSGPGVLWALSSTTSPSKPTVPRSTRSKRKAARSCTAAGAEPPRRLRRADDRACPTSMAARAARNVRPDSLCHDLPHAGRSCGDAERRPARLVVGTLHE